MSSYPKPARTGPFKTFAVEGLTVELYAFEMTHGVCHREARVSLPSGNVWAKQGVGNDGKCRKPSVGCEPMFSMPIDSGKRALQALEYVVRIAEIWDASYTGLPWSKEDGDVSEVFA